MDLETTLPAPAQSTQPGIIPGNFRHDPSPLAPDPGAGTSGEKPNSKTPLPGSIQVFQPCGSTVQRRVILELPHDVTDEAREHILRDWCRANLRTHNTVCHADIHRPPDPIPHGQVLFRNVPCRGVQARNPLARDTFRGMRQNYASIANEHLRNQASRNAAIPAPTATRASTSRPARTAAPRPAPCARKASRPHGTATFASGKRCRLCRQPPPGTCPETRKIRHRPDPTNRAPACLRRERRPPQNPDRPSCRRPLRGLRKDPFPIIRKPRVRLCHALSGSTRAILFPRRNFLPPLRHDQRRGNDPLHVSHGLHQRLGHTSRSRPAGIHRPRTSLRFFHRKHQRRFRGEQKCLV